MDIIKIDKVWHCIACRFNKFYPAQSFKISRFRCINDDAKTKNGNYRIINKELVMKGKIPGWCKLEDYKG